ncbi:hypothetical protein UFOVP199_28 [uncultured Caudovirales phage]|uniref:Uncharacterized protein n=1 Tax=uncultured Caudovirales phage TaxID=2100421 RepID=A0A6J7WHR2_9CAUD|nr:hypothetical protein UFOVP199_28 [uncultured Caudovirales phage]
MTSAYPSGFDSLTNPAASDPLSSPAHATQHINANDAIEAIEATLGVNPQGTVSTVNARFGVLEAFMPTLGSAVSNAALSAAQSATSASAASVYAGSANTDYLATAALYDSFDDRYLGAKSVAPTVDNDGNTLLIGALYFNTVSHTMFVWTGTVWVDASMSTYSWTGPVSIVANDANPALKITQSGSGDVLRVEDSASPDTTPFVIDTNGNVSTFGSVTISNIFTATAGTVTGLFTAGSVTATGTVTAGAVTTAGAVSAASVSASGSVSVTGAFTAGSVTTAGVVSAGSFTTAGTATAGAFTTAGTATAGRFSGHGAVTVCTSSTRPGSPSAGDLIFETDTKLYYGYSGIAWASVGGSSAAAGDFSSFLLMGA